MILQWFPLKIFLTTSTCLFSLTQGSPPFLKLDFGLFSRLEPTIPFSHWSAVSPLKSHDFRFHEPTIPFSHWSAVSPSKSHDFRFHEPTILFSHWSAVFLSKTRDFRFHEPTIPFSNWSAVSHPTSGHDVTRPIRSQD